MKHGTLVAPEHGNIVEPGDPDDAEPVPCDYCQTEPDTETRGAVIAVATADDEERLACATHLIGMMDAVLRPRVEERDDAELMEGTPWGE